MSNVTIADFRQWKNAPTEPSDLVIQEAIDAAELKVADDLHRTIVLATETATTRKFVANTNSLTLRVPDFATATGLVIVNNTTTLASTAYQLEPLDNLNAAGQTVPYDTIRMIDGTRWYESLYGAYGVTVTARWGWASLPANYTQAVKVLAADVLDSRDVRNGVIGFTDYAGVRVKENGTVKMLLDSLRRGRGHVGPIRSGSWFA